MGNCWTGEQHKARVVQVVKMDGKILEFAASILVKDLLVKFPGSGVGLSTKSPECLPLSNELKLGNVHFLFPLLNRPCPTTADRHQAAAETDSPTEDPGNVVKTIKVVITKKQLQDLISKKISFDAAVLSETKSPPQTCPADSPRVKGWKPELESIPEGIEFGFSCIKKNPTSFLLSM